MKETSINKIIHDKDQLYRCYTVPESKQSIEDIKQTLRDCPDDNYFSCMMVFNNISIYILDSPTTNPTEQLMYISLQFGVANEISLQKWLTRDLRML